MNNPKLLQNRVDGIMKWAKQRGSKYVEEAEDYLISQGMAYKGKDGKLHAIDNPEAWARGLALATGSNMERLFIGGMRIDQKYNPETGEVLTNADASQSFKDGLHIDKSNSYNAGTYSYNPDGFEQRLWDKINKEHPNMPLNKKMELFNQEMANFRRHQSEADFKNDLIFWGGAGGAALVGLLEAKGVHDIFEEITAGKVKLNTDKLLDKGAVKYTAEDIENNPELLKEGIREPGYYIDGKRVATLEGFATDPETGRVIEKGLINRTARKAWDKLDNWGKKLSPFKSFKQGTEETVQKTTNTANNDSSSGKQTNPEENFHDNPPSNSSTTSIDDTKENVNLT